MVKEHLGEFTANRLIIFCIIAGIFSVLIHGYSFGVGNQIDQLPLVMRAMDSSFAKNDFVVNTDSVFGPRFFYVHFLATLGKLFPLWSVFLALTLVSNIAVAVISGFFTRKLFGSELAGVFAAVAVLSLSSVQIGGATMLVLPILSPQILAMPFALLAIWMGFEGRLRLAVLFSVCSAFLHPLVGLETGGLILLTSVLLRKNITTIILGFLVIGAVALTFLIPEFRNSGVSDQSFINNLAHFRNPHHYLPSTWPLGDYIDLGGFLVACVAAWFLWQKSKRVDFGKRVFFPIFVMLILFFCLFGYVFVEVWPSKLVTLSQPFRMIFLVKWVGLCLMWGVVAKYLASKGDKLKGAILWAAIFLPLAVGITSIFRIFSGAWFLGARENLLFIFLVLLALTVFRLRFSFVLTVAIFGVVTLAVLVLGPYRNGRLKQIVLLSDISGSDAAAARWARENTDRDAIFLTPYDFGEFRILGERAIVSDIKADPYKPLDRQIWQERLFDSYGTDTSLFSQNYKNIDRSRLEFIKNKYNADYAVLYIETPSDLPLIYQNDMYKIVEII